MALGKKTGGRQKGSLNKRTVALGEATAAIAEKIGGTIEDAFEGDAHAYMMTVYKDPANETVLRLYAAKAAIRFEKPSLAAIEHTGKDGADLLPKADHRETAKAVIAILGAAVVADEPEDSPE